MARKAATAKTSTINRAAASTAVGAGAASYPDLENWPRSWMGWEKDVPAGERLVSCFRPFIEDLSASAVSRKTMRRHVDNLWRLGGEIIRDLNQTPSLRRADIERLLRDRIHEDGGLLLYHGSEEEQRSFDSTCRKLHRFLKRHPL